MAPSINLEVPHSPLPSEPLSTSLNATSEDELTMAVETSSFQSRPGVRPRGASRCSRKPGNDGPDITEEQPTFETGDEASENSLIWYIYNEEAFKSDSSMVEGSHREIDVLLVFTGLFSAVLTTFIIQAYQMILPDPVDETNELLWNITKLLPNNTLAGQNLHFADQDPPNPSDGQIQWVTGLWFTALACSLSTALISMLAKQWLYAYTRGISGTPRDRARKRQNRFIQFRKWHVLTVVNSLPLLLHAALFLFFGGVVGLLWRGELALSVATVIIIALAYIFYIGSMWISLISPDCPYQHPISTHLHHWLRPGRDLYGTRASSSEPRGFEGWSSTEDFDEKDPLIAEKYASAQDVVPTLEDSLDAAALVWLLKETTSTEAVRSSALQAIAGLPREFTAYKHLRQAEAIEMVLERFESCFRLNTSFSTHWHIVDPHAAEKYCRGWMRLTYQTRVKWPTRLLRPLEMLRDYNLPAPISSTAACALAISSLERHEPQSHLLALLSRHLDGKLMLSWSAQQVVLDTLLECIAHWELSTAVIASIVSQAVPILVRLLHSLPSSSPYTLREAIVLNLYALTGHFLDENTRRDGASRKEIYREAVITALSDVAQKRGCYGVEDNRLLDTVAMELARIADVLVKNPQGLSASLHESVKVSLTSLYLENRLAHEKVQEETMANVLYLLHPPDLQTSEQQAQLTHHLINTLKHTKHPSILSNSALRLLDSHLATYSTSAMEAFLDGGGMDLLLHIANSGSIESRKSQMDSLRALCTFIKTSATLQLEDDDFPPIFFDTIFRSDFLRTLCSLVTTAKLWIPDVALVWLPALVKLCRVRPSDSNWRHVEQTFHRYADLHQYDYRHNDLMANLNRIRDLRRQLEGGAGVSFFEEDF